MATSILLEQHLHQQRSGRRPARGTYGYYEVNDRGTVGKAGADIYSLYVQDQWTPATALTLNLGLRTENEIIPSFRPKDRDAFEFRFGDKLAPRLGATYDLRATAGSSCIGSWGRYFDWTKYELARGSFGGDFWHIYYRSLDTLDIGSLNLSNKPGARSVEPGVRTVPRPPRAELRRRPIRTSSRCIRTAPASASSTSSSDDSVVGVPLHSQRSRRTPLRTSAASIERRRSLRDRQPRRRRLGTITPTSGATPAVQPHRSRSGSTTRSSSTYSRRFANGWFASASYTLSRLYGNYAGLASSDEIMTPTTGVSSATAQQQAGTSSRQGGNANRAWDIDELMFGFSR